MRNWLWVQECGKSGPGARGGVPVGAWRGRARRWGGPGCGARGRWRGLVAVPVGGGRARAGLEIDHSEPKARVWRSRGRAAAHRHTERPDRTRQIMRSGRRARRAKLAARTVSGRAAAHGHTKQPGLTRQKILQPEVWQLVQRLNSAQDAQQLEPQQINEKHQPSHQRSQLHSNTPKSHMRNMRAS